jgi:hypothetical protein
MGLISEVIVLGLRIRIWTGGVAENVEEVTISVLDIIDLILSAELLTVIQ